MIDKKSIMDMGSKCSPIGDRVIVVPEEKEKITRTGIARAQSAKGEDETQIGTVISVGPGYNTEYGQFIPTTSKVGDKVLLDRFNGVTVRIDSKGKVHPQHAEIREDMIPVRIVRQDGILWTFPEDWPE